MAVHVSIHDVSPLWEKEVDVALEMTDAFGVKPALLVVPDFHGRAPLTGHPAYCEKLRGLARRGHEVVLHGYYHRAREAAERPNAPGIQGVGERARRAWAQRVVSGGEAEFSDVSPEEARQRLDDGERVLRDAGLVPAGFIAPAWSMPRWVLSLLGERGYRFTEDHTTVYDPKGGRKRASLVLNFASRTPGRLLSSVAWCRLARPARRVMPARIAIHPADVRFALLRDEIRSLLAWGKGDFVDRASDLLG
jgi:uncharacterized protein